MVSQPRRATGPTRWGWVALVLTVLVVIIAVGVVFVALSERSFIYFPDRSNPGSVAAHFSAGEDVLLATRDGLTLEAWWVPPSGDQATHPAVLYLPGNGGNRLGRVSVAQALSEQGIGVLLLDYRGYGANPGSPTEAGLIRDAHAGVEWLQGRGFSSQQIILVGESLGTGVALAVAGQTPVAGVVLRSPYTSLADVGRHAFRIPVGWVMRDKFDSRARISTVQAPILVLAGAGDELIPVEQSRELAELAPQLHDIVVVPKAGHNDALWFGPFLAQQVAELAASL